MTAVHAVRPEAIEDREPDDIEAVADYLIGRGLGAGDPEAEHALRGLLEFPTRYSEGHVSVTQAARHFYVGRRGLARRCRRSDLPTPSRILAFGRVLRTVRLISRGRMTIRSAATATGWPDPFSMSNTMYRLTGIRPSDARSRGLIWVAEAWLAQEIEAGHARLHEPKPPRCPSCGQTMRPSEGA